MFTNARANELLKMVDVQMLNNSDDGSTPPAGNPQIDGRIAYISTGKIASSDVAMSFIDGLKDGGSNIHTDIITSYGHIRGNDITAVQIGQPGHACGSNIYGNTTIKKDSSNGHGDLTVENDLTVDGGIITSGLTTTGDVDIKTNNTMYIRTQDNNGANTADIRIHPGNAGIGSTSFTGGNITILAGGSLGSGGSGGDYMSMGGSGVTPGSATLDAGEPFATTKAVLNLGANYAGEVKVGNATSKLTMHGGTGVTQGTIIDAVDAASTMDRLNDLLAHLRTRGDLSPTSS